ncbi:uncharacterized protein I303_103640 [Kwoniella dejecticola CBS 10117]|uniref:Uncharacterized protein n=1 Tax=Kwoniella dejecticola CBS 10117 TaxID=1296121 RepID=A0A1A6A7B2_9TREE|nr:uncharacterized protein I303_03661 [Kwoniella dejecticola CBS 10117]OBR85946.1 hypothetical protein I303_03661 [Kwoniella dejecticola CBS 10117]
MTSIADLPKPPQSHYGQHKYTYTQHRSSLSDPSSSSGASSPMSLPPYLPSDLSDDLSPSSNASSCDSDSILTPEIGDNSVEQDAALLTTPKMGFDHSMLSSMSQQPTPKLIIPFEGSTSSSAARFPLLPPHNPLRSKMYSIPEHSSGYPQSPAHTPKGHPLESGRSHSGYFAYDAKTKTHPITNPYGSGNLSYTTTVSYLLRIPRRLRPVLLVGVCVFTFGLVLLNRAMNQAAHLDHVVNQQNLAFGRRYVDLYHTDHGKASDHAIMAERTDNARQAEAGVQKVLVAGGKVLEFESPEEEFAAVISYMTSTTANALPAVDPSKPLDPHTILDFDPTHPNAREDLNLLQEEINTMYPIVLVGRMRDPWHREIQRILSEYKIQPPPLVIDLDQRKDHATIIPLFERLLDTSVLPQLVVQGKSLGSYHDILDMRDSGRLIDTLQENESISIQEIVKKKKKGIREKERIENERILRPAPIVPQ